MTTNSPSTSQTEPPTKLAHVIPVPEPYRQKVRTRSYAIKVNLIGLMPLIFILAGLGAVGIGGYLFSQSEFVASGFLFVLGAASIAWGCYVGTACICVYENRWIEKRLRTEILSRPDSLLDPRDARSIYVSLIPRESFTQVALTMSSDLLLMRIDENRRVVLLEGDSDRYQIPAESIAKCESQCFFHPIDGQQKNEIWMVRLVFQTDQGSRELLLSVDHTDFKPRGNAKRHRIADETCLQILSLCQVSSEVPVGLTNS